MENQATQKWQKTIQRAGSLAMSAGQLALVFYGLGVLAVKYFQAEEEFEFVPTNLLDVVFTLAVAIIFIVLGNRIRKGAGDKTRLYLQILTTILVVLIASNLVIQQRLGVGILGLLVLGYLLIALYAIRKIRALSAKNIASVDTAQPASTQTSVVATGRSQTAAAIAIVVAAALIAGAIYLPNTDAIPPELAPTILLGSLTLIFGICTTFLSAKWYKTEKYASILGTLIIATVLLAIASVWQYELYQRVGKQMVQQRLNQKRMEPTVLHIKNLVERGQAQAARQITEGMSKDEYELYKATKKQMGITF